MGRQMSAPPARPSSASLRQPDAVARTTATLRVILAATLFHLMTGLNLVQGAPTQLQQEAEAEVAEVGAVRAVEGSSRR